MQRWPHHAAAHLLQTAAGYLLVPSSDHKIPVEIPISDYSSSIIQQNTVVYTVQYGLYTTVQKYSFCTVQSLQYLSMQPPYVW